MSTVAVGTEFENRVAELYRLMGYEVKQNVIISGSQFDILLTYIQPGGITTKTAVECKYVNNGNLSLTEFRKNLTAMMNIRQNKKVDTLVYLTTNGFAKNISSAANENEIKLLTFQELEHNILQIDPFIDSIIQSFEKDDISNYYVDIIAHSGNNNISPKPIMTKINTKRTVSKTKKTEVYDPLDDFICTWLNDKMNNHISILGEYGTGKTSFCRKLAHDLAKKYKVDRFNNRIPVLINLRDYSKVMSVRQLITDLMINEYGLRNIDYPLFKKMNENGMFLLIFDGFDEMAQKVIFDTAYTNFSKIAELANPKQSKVLLTCRTEFFRTHEKEEEILIDIADRKNFGLIYLKEFNENQIKKFLKLRVPLIEKRKRIKKGWEFYFEKIHEIFDLSDLAKRPVLLELITKHLPTLIGQKKDINASTLYQTAIRNEIKRRMKIGEAIIKGEDRIKLMKLLAVWMYKNDKLFVHWKNIPELLDLKIHFELKTRLDIEYHINDFLTSSLLNRDPAGNYRFSHKSFVDFLTAWQFAADIGNDKREDFQTKKIPYELLQFLKHFNINKDNLYNWIKYTKNKSFSETNFLAGNSINVLNSLGENFQEKKPDFSETVLEEANFEGIDLSGLSFHNANLKNAVFKNVLLTNTDISYAWLKNTHFDAKNYFHFLDISYKNNFIAVCHSNSEDIYIFDLKKNEYQGIIKENEGVIRYLCFSPDGRFLTSGSDDHSIRIWDTGSWKLIHTLEKHTGSIQCLAFHPDGCLLASGSNDRSIRIWGTDSWKLLNTFEAHKDIVCCLAFSPNGKMLASGSADKSIRIWIVESGKLLDTIEKHSESVLCLRYSFDGKLLASGSADNTIQIWDTETRNLIKTLRGHTDNIYCLAFSPDDKILASESEDNTILIWDTESWKLIYTLEKQSDTVYYLAFSPDGKRLECGSADRTVRFWNVKKRWSNFSECKNAINLTSDYKGMNISGSRGLDINASLFLIERGAVKK